LPESESGKIISRGVRGLCLCGEEASEMRLTHKKEGGQKVRVGNLVFIAELR